MKRCLIITSVLILFVALNMKNLKAQTQIQFFEKEIITEGNDTLPFQFSKPLHMDKGEKYPLVVFLHGSGERGRDNEKQMIHTRKQFCDTIFREKYPCYIIAPQCPENKRWVEVDWSADSHTTPEEPSCSMKLLFKLIDEKGSNEQIDINRIYITGLSMGGYGTWDALVRKPGLFAAAIPICGGGDTERAEVLINIPIWVFHGAQDKAVKVERSRDMVEAIRKKGGNPIYTEIATGKHNVWTGTYDNQQTWDWLFTQKK